MANQDPQAPLDELQNVFIKVVTGMLGCAPGTFLDDIEYVFRNDAQGDWVALANILAETPFFNEHLYAKSLSNEAFSQAFLTSLLGTNDGTIVATEAYQAAETWLTNRLVQTHGHRGQAMLDILVALYSVPENDPVWGAARQQFILRSDLAAALTQNLIGTGQEHSTLDALMISHSLVDWANLISMQSLNGMPDTQRESLFSNMLKLIQLGEAHPTIYHALQPKIGGFHVLQDALPGNATLSNLLDFLIGILQSANTGNVENLIPLGGQDILAYFAQLKSLGVSLDTLLQTVAHPGVDLQALKDLLQTHTQPPAPTPQPLPDTPQPSLDTTPPTASVAAARATQSASVQVQSSEPGTAYLVKDTITVTSLASITSAADNQFNSIAIGTAHTDTALVLSSLLDGSYHLYAVDAAGNLSAASTNAITIDSAAPTASITAATAMPSASVQVQSSEPGTAYLVKDTLTVTHLTSITGAADNQFNTVAINTANSDTALALSGLLEGSYHLYTVDAAGNLSAASANTVTVDSTAPNASVATTTAMPSASVQVRSSETGTAYLVKDTVSVTSLTSITGAADNQFNSVAIGAAHTDTALALTGLADGSYHLYAVDAAGNLSTASANAITINSGAPTLQSSTPADNAIYVPVDANLTLTFDKAIQVGSGNVLLKKFGDHSTVATIDIADSSQISISGATLTINPSSDLAWGTGYYLEIGRGVVTDLVGNAFAGINDSATLNFATHTLPANVILPVTSHNGAASGLTFGFLDANGSGTART